MRAAATAAESCGRLDLDAWCIGKDFDDAGARFTKLYGLSTRGACLVRPDGFVAWRSEDAVADATATLREALHRSLAH
jgi:putative polyketide hydroxylase